MASVTVEMNGGRGRQVMLLQTSTTHMWVEARSPPPAVAARGAIKAEGWGGWHVGVVSGRVALS